jgi:putative membrane protein
MDGTGWVALLTVLFWVALITVAVLTVRWGMRLTRSVGESISDGRSPWWARTSAREALDQRYARGEISREDYLQARRDLGEPH